MTDNPELLPDEIDVIVEWVNEAPTLTLAKHHRNRDLWGWTKYIRADIVRPDKAVEALEYLLARVYEDDGEVHEIAEAAKTIRDVLTAPADKAVEASLEIQNRAGHLKIFLADHFCGDDETHIRKSLETTLSEISKFAYAITAPAVDVLERLKRDSVDVEIEAEEQDVFNHRSGHSTRPTGRYTVVLMGVSAEDADHIKRTLQSGEGGDGK